MPAPTLTPRTKWIEEGLDALAAGGPDAVRVEPLARSLGVTKGGFYGHFGDRRALLEEMLDTWERTMVDEVIARVEEEGDGPKARLQRLFAIATSGPGLLEAELAIRDWARRDRAVARRVKRVDNRRMEFMRSLFDEICRDEDEAEARCLLAFSLFIGSPFVTADHRGGGRIEVMERALAGLLESHGDGDLHR
jgi:AcrR family transcriptional regulator